MSGKTEEREGVNGNRERKKVRRGGETRRDKNIYWRREKDGRKGIVKGRR